MVTAQKNTDFYNYRRFHQFYPCILHRFYILCVKLEGGVVVAGSSLSIMIVKEPLLSLQWYCFPLAPLLVTLRKIKLFYLPIKKLCSLIGKTEAQFTGLIIQINIGC